MTDGECKSLHLKKAFDGRSRAGLDPAQGQEGAVGTESFDGFLLATKKEAEEILRSGRDPQGFFYSVFTWIVLAWFVGGFWEDT